jgi:uncharacterized membrane protein
MHFLDTITITCAGLMVGNELAVSAFFNPAARQLESGPQTQSLSILARSLGRVMPVWYGLCFALLALESVLHRHQAAFALLLTAALIWSVAIAFSIVLLVPINNRIAALNLAAPAPGWKADHRRWDLFHRARILLLAIAFVALAYALAG